MSTDILELEAVSVTRFAGGTVSRAGQRERGRCYQITEGGMWVELTRKEAVAVARAILEAEKDAEPVKHE